MSAEDALADAPIWPTRTLRCRTRRGRRARGRSGLRGSRRADVREHHGPRAVLTERHEILYDPDCGFCRVCVALVLKWDRTGRLRPVALTSSEGEELLAGMPESERMASWHLIEPRWSGIGPKNATIPDHLAGERSISSAGAAFSPLFRLLPAGAPLARLTDRFPEAAERGYRWVADRRSAVGKLIPAAVERWADRVIAARAASESGPDGR